MLKIPGNLNKNMKILKKLTPKQIRIIRIAGLIIIVIGLVVLIYPFWPQIEYKINPPQGNAYPYSTKLQNVNTNESGPPVIANKIPGENRVVIPKIGVDMKIVEGTNEKVALNQGAWHYPTTSTPNQGGNTVITGHRFKYRPPSKETFYLLDKLEKGDKFIVYWQGIEYDYEVTETKVVEKNAVEILNNTEEPIVTLFTCTPLFTTKQRLVVIGKLIE